MACALHLTEPKRTNHPSNNNEDKECAHHWWTGGRGRTIYVHVLLLKVCQTFVCVVRNLLAVVVVFMGENRELLVVVVVVTVNADLACGVFLILSALVVVCALAPGHCAKDIIACDNTKAIGDNALFAKQAIKQQTCQKTARISQVACESSSLCTLLESAID